MSLAGVMYKVDEHTWHGIVTVCNPVTLMRKRKRWHNFYSVNIFNWFN